MDTIARGMAIALLAGLMACGTTVTSRNVESAGARDLFTGAAGGRDLAVTVVGNPFAVGDNVLAAAVIDAMQGNNVGPPTRFTTRASANAEPGFRVVVAFNPRPSVPDYRLCYDDAPAPPTRPPGENLDVVMAFCGSPWLRSAFCGATGWCRKTTLISAVAARAPMAAPGDEAFRRLLAGMTAELIPDTNAGLQSRF